MSSRAESLTDAFKLLRQQCDPRGHSLLDSLESLCITESIALDALMADTSEEKKDVVEAIQRYSVRVPDYPPENLGLA